MDVVRFDKKITMARTPSRPAADEPCWARWSDERLLDLRFCDLKLSIAGTPLEARVGKLYRELSARRIRFRPHCWLAEEWFSPDGIPGIGIPFYLAHPRLTRLERKLMLEVEGGPTRWCMRLLRHEAGHAVDTAFRLHRRQRWRKIFGKASRPYPDSYTPRPYSMNYVLNLGLWYAQAHPSEDFAETFAVWLKPRSRWRIDYQDWPALRKLRYVHEVMAEVSNQAPPVRSRQRVDPISRVTRTLREHYEHRRDYYANDDAHFYDRDLLRLFATGPEYRKRPRASAFLRRMRPELREITAYWTGQNRYTIHQVLREMVQRCEELDLRVDKPPEEARRHALVMVAVQTINYLHSGHFRVAV